MKDTHGTAIRAGCYIIYPMRRGSSLWMCIGYVNETQSERVSVIRTRLGHEEKPAQVWLTKTDRSLIIPFNAVPSRLKLLLSYPLAWGE